VVILAIPTINTTSQPASAALGASIADQATVSGGANPTGTVTFNLYSNASGTGTPLFTNTENLVGGTATSASYTPAECGTFYWVATYNGDANNSAVTSGTSSEPVTIQAPEQVSANCVPIANAVQGVFITPVTMTGTGGCGGPYTFSATGLPTALIMSPSGTIFGLPAEAGSFAYAVTITDQSGNSATVPCTCIINPPLSANCVTIANAVQGMLIAPVTMTGFGGCAGPYTFLASGLPTGLTMSLSGTITGTPTVVGSLFNYSVKITDRCGYSATVNCSLNVAYSWSGFLSPFPKSTYKSGSTIPIKFMLAGASAGIKNLVATGSVAPIDKNGTVGTYTPIGTFKYDPITGNYVLNWSTKPTTAGSFLIMVDFNDGAPHTVQVTLKP
jgi:hypothetical protein